MNFEKIKQKERERDEVFRLSGLPPSVTRSLRLLSISFRSTLFSTSRFGSTKSGKGIANRRPAYWSSHPTGLQFRSCPIIK